jgi:outer membrane lipoprotein-sorting protein
MIKSFSVAAMAVLVLVGCNSGSTEGSSTKAASLADAKKLAQNITTGTSLGSSVGSIGSIAGQSINTLSTKSTRSTFNQSCLNGGNMAMTFDENQFSYSSTPKAMDMAIEMQNCNQNGEISNGKITFKIQNLSGDNMNMDISFPTNFTTIADGKTMTIKAGGSMQMKHEAPYEVMILNIEVTDGSESYGGENLVYKMKENSDGSSEVFPVSGKENFGTGVYFMVDPNYDASRTPMVIDHSGNLQVGGLYKYLDGANHHVEVEVTATNEVTVWVDENGDGNHDANEVEVVPLGN